MTEKVLSAMKRGNKHIFTEKKLVLRNAGRKQIIEVDDTISSPEAARRFMENLLEEQPYESLYVIALNNSNEVLGSYRVAHGSVEKAWVYPRKLLSYLLLETGATNIILYHNHPGGTRNPSKEDIAITKRVDELVRSLDIRLLDHLIYARGEWYSMAEEGDMQRIASQRTEYGAQ